MLIWDCLVEQNLCWFNVVVNYSALNQCVYLSSASRTNRASHPSQLNLQYSIFHELIDQRHRLFFTVSNHEMSTMYLKNTISVTNSERPCLHPAIPSPHFTATFIAQLITTLGPCQIYSEQWAYLYPSSWLPTEFQPKELLWLMLIFGLWMTPDYF